MKTRWLSLGWVLGSVVMLAGCAPDKLTRQNYDTVREGASTRTEIEMTFGKDYIDHGDSWEYEREDKHLAVYFHFDPDGRVIRKEWVDAKTGEWDGAAPGIDETPLGRKAAEGTRTTTIKKD